MLEVARVYDHPTPDGSLHVLVDRLWPRGIRKDDPRIEDWWPELAPSSSLRTWYGHDPERFDEFAVRYEAELRVAEAEAEAALARAREVAAAPGLTLLTATKHLEIGHVRVLARVLAPDR